MKLTIVTLLYSTSVALAVSIASTSTTSVGNLTVVENITDANTTDANTTDANTKIVGEIPTMMIEDGEFGGVVDIVGEFPDEYSVAEVDPNEDGSMGIGVIDADSVGKEDTTTRNLSEQSSARKYIRGASKVDAVEDEEKRELHSYYGSGDYEYGYGHGHGYGYGKGKSHHRYHGHHGHGKGKGHHNGYYGYGKGKGGHYYYEVAKGSSSSKGSSPSKGSWSKGSSPSKGVSWSKGSWSSSSSKGSW